MIKSQTEMPRNQLVCLSLITDPIYRLLSLGFDKLAACVTIYVPSYQNVRNLLTTRKCLETNICSISKSDLTFQVTLLSN